MTNFLSSLCILEIRPLSDVGLVKIFSHYVGCCFVLLTVSFTLQKLFSFRRSHFLIVSLSVCAAEVIFGKWSPEPMCSSVLSTFSSMKFSVVGFTLRFFFYLLGLDFVHGNRHGYIFILLHADSQACQYHLLKMPSFSIVYFWLFIFVTNQVLIGVWIYVRVI